jgi:hypothetical protein
MLKIYVEDWKLLDVDGEYITDYKFCSQAENASNWETLNEAKGNCVLLDQQRIEIRSSEGEIHICRGFQWELRAQGDFVIFCTVPFVGQVLHSSRSC